jgi:hypothetical protein
MALIQLQNIYYTEIHRKVYRNCEYEPDGHGFEFAECCLGS